MLYFKGWKAIQAYRMAHVLWQLDRKDLALVIQARCTEVFGIDLHPAADIGCGLMIDHGTGVVIGETARIGNNCTLMHGVTLGGTGKSTAFDRHPKLGNNVFLGAMVTVLGNILIEDGVTVGAGSLVLKPLPAGATAVGSPAVVKSISQASSLADLLLTGEAAAAQAELVPPPPAGKDKGESEGGGAASSSGGGALSLWAGVSWAPKRWQRSSL